MRNQLEEIGDVEFDAIYAEKYRKHSAVHWTPVEVIKIALQWLEISGESKVLDIGSGVGKFCALGSLTTSGHFTGVEVRKDLVESAKDEAKKFGLKNVEYIHSDITDVDFKVYNSFYYFNPFCEHLAIADKIDDTIIYSPDTFRQYEDYVVHQLSKSPISTRVVTYYAQAFPFPDTFELKDMMFDGTLALWVKIKH